MCKQAGPAAKAPRKSGGGRTKLWEIHHNWICSVLGTCLTLGELRRLAGKYGIDHRGMSDYALHGRMIRECSQRSGVSRVVQRLLDRKYASAIRQLKDLDSREGLIDAWKTAVTNGEITGTYWAVMSHPRCDSTAIYQAFGDIHMLSHLQGANRRVDLKQLADATAEAEAERRRAAELQDELHQVRAQLQSSEALLRSQQEAEARLRQTLQRERARFEADAVVRQRDALRSEVEGLRDQLREQALRAEEAERSGRESRCEQRRASDRASQLEAERDALLSELSAAEAQLTQLLSKLVIAPSCGDCPDPVCLTGKCVLYVGGRTGLVRHYREFVERRGGAFVHHDGGLEEKTGQLDALVRRASVVLCPIDAVSHDACLRVKRACKHSACLFIPLRSSGVTSLATALHSLGEVPEALTAK